MGGGLSFLRLGCCLCIRIELTLETNVRLTARFVPVIVLDLVMGMST